MKRYWCRTLAGHSLVATTLLTPFNPPIAAASSADPHASAPMPTEQVLFLEVLVNRAPLKELIGLRVSGGQVWADRDALRDLGLRADAIPMGLWQGDFLCLDSLPGVDVAYDRLRQRLALMVPVDLLDRTTLHAKSPSDPATTPADASPTGFVLNYDLNLQHAERDAQRSTSLGSWSEWRLFNPWGVFTQTLYSRLAQQGVASTQPRHLRLDTTWRTDFPEHALSVVFGDTATSGNDWSRPVRIGGLRIGTDFGLQPYRSIRPLTSFQGQALLPSTVDVFINGMLQEQMQVLPGRFTVESLASINGAGMAQVVVTDVTGQRSVVEIPIYGTLDLLQPGLTEWSLEVGAARTTDMLGKTSYASDVLMNGVWRRGWSDTLTLEGQAGRGVDTRLMGMGAVTRLGGQGGMLNASLAFSNGRAGASGQQATVGFQWSSQPWRVSVQSRRASAQFRDLYADIATAPLRRNDRVLLGFAQNRWDIGFTALRQRDDRGQSMNMASVATQWQTPAGWRWSVGWTHVRATRTEHRLGVTLTIPLSQEHSLALSAQRQAGATTYGWELRKSPSGNDDWTWRLGQALSGGSAQMGASVNTAVGRWHGSLDRFAAGPPWGTSTVARTSFGGGLAVVAGQAFLTAPIDDAFALVSTNGLPGLPVQLEHHPVGRTDAQGYLLVPRLSAHQRNQLSVDVLDLPYEVAASATTLQAIPQRLRGTQVHFDLHRVVSVRATVLDAARRHLPTGSAVTLESPPEGASPADAQHMTLFPQIGHEGSLFIENPLAGAILRITSPQGSECRIQVPSREKDSPLQVDLGELICQ